MISATATEMQNNFGRYLNLVISGQEVIVTKNGHEVGRFVPKDMAISRDVLQNRENFVRASSMVWKLCETEQAKGYISALTFANLVYIMRKEMDAQRIEEVLHMLSLIFEFAELNDSDLFRAAALQWPDFGDAVQSVTAERIHADYIITRNVRDFSRSKVIAFTPDELLARL